MLTIGHGEPTIARERPVCSHRQSHGDRSGIRDLASGTTLGRKRVAANYILDTQFYHTPSPLVFKPGQTNRHQTLCRSTTSTSSKHDV
jgi:hypothetical protein